MVGPGQEQDKVDKQCKHRRSVAWNFYQLRLRVWVPYPER